MVWSSDTVRKSFNNIDSLTGSACMIGSPNALRERERESQSEYYKGLSACTNGAKFRHHLELLKAACAEIHCFSSDRRWGYTLSRCTISGMELYPTNNILTAWPEIKQMLVRMDTNGMLNVLTCSEVAEFNHLWKIGVSCWCIVWLAKQPTGDVLFLPLLLLHVGNLLIYPLANGVSYPACGMWWCALA